MITIGLRVGGGREVMKGFVSGMIVDCLMKTYRNAGNVYYSFYIDLIVL